MQNTDKNFGMIVYLTDIDAYIMENGCMVPSPEDETVPLEIHTEFDPLYQELATYAQAYPDRVITRTSLEKTPEQLEAEAHYLADAIINTYLRATILQSASFTTTEYNTLASAHCFEAWQTGTSYTAGQRIEHNGVVYEVVQDVTAIETQPPDATGMLAVYRPLSVDPSTGEEPDGTKENPYAYIEGMDVHEGSYYTYEDKLYLAKTDMLPCVWAPGTAGLWQWEEVTL